MTRNLMIGTLMLLTSISVASAQYPGWQYSGSLYILTTPEGADLPSTALEKDFPLLVRLDKDFFDLTQARANGEDIRFATGEGTPLAYQIEQWNSAKGTASIWVRIPEIKGNERQELKLFWGKADAESESDGSAVFNAENGFATVLHMTEALKDECNAITPDDQGTTCAGGIIGEGRHFTRGKGIHCGSHITTYPFSDSPSTSEAWFRAESTGSTIFYWGRYATRLNGNTGDGNEVSLNIGSPASLNWASDGPGGTNADTPPVLGRWNHVAATSVTLQFKAVYADPVKTRSIPVAITEDIPEPVVALRAPTTWNGRETIEVTAATPTSFKGSPMPKLRGRITARRSIPPRR